MKHMGEGGKCNDAKYFFVELRDLIEWEEWENEIIK